MPRFSERHGYSVEKAIQYEFISRDLRTSIWNFLEDNMLPSGGGFLGQDPHYFQIAKFLYDDFHRRKIREIPNYIPEFVKLENIRFDKYPWNIVYGYCEFWFEFAPANDGERLAKQFNIILERDKAAYRLIEGKIVPIIESEQLTAIEAALHSTDKYKAASEHIRVALSLYGNRGAPDYRNSVKELISAVESAAKVISGLNSATLGQALAAIDSKRPMHEAFKQALLKLYGYTSDEKGIRHALLDEASVDEADARFMLVACSAFVSFLVSHS